MNVLKTRLLIFATLGFAAMMACTLFSPPTPTPDPAAESTAAAQTLAAQLTQTIAAMETAGISQPTSTPTPTSLPPTNTPTPTNTPLPTPTPIPCDWAQFIKDVTIPDGSILAPGANFTKVWRLKNIGSCTWTGNYDLVFARGDGMNATATVPMPDNVLPGQAVDVAVKFTAPLDGGDYRGYWMLRNASGIIFGIGPGADDPFWVDIRVLEPISAFEFDFATNYCLADWRTAAGKLTCPSSSPDDDDGFILYLDNPTLENRHENEPTLITHPDFNVGGWIQGIYPPYEVKDGDHFRAWVGCLDDSAGCDVIFKLEYRIGGGPIQLIDQWHEVYDGDVTVIDIDLSPLKGKDVQFILSVVVDGGDPEDANAFWFVPRIENE